MDYVRVISFPQNMYTFTTLTFKQLWRKTFVNNLQNCEGSVM